MWTVYRIYHTKSLPLKITKMCKNIKKKTNMNSIGNGQWNRYSAHIATNIKIIPTQEYEISIIFHS